MTGQPSWRGKKELVSGDMVRVYSAESGRGVFTAKVLGPYGDVSKSLIDVELEDGRRGSYYRKQCRRLVPKPKVAGVFVTREKLKKAYHEAFGGDSFGHVRDREWFPMLCKALGLGDSGGKK